MIDLGLKVKETLFKDTEKELLAEFYAKGTGKSNKEFRFAKVDSRFVNFLPYLNDGTVKLYLYYAIAAKSDTGESWHSMDTISRNLDVTERSIGNWNRQLEDLGLIFRINNRRKSKATFVLPLTSFALKMSTQKMEQILTELELGESNEYSKVFGRLQSITKLYMKGPNSDSISGILCIHLNRVSAVKSKIINSANVYIFDTISKISVDVEEKLLEYDGDSSVVVVDGDEIPLLGMKKFDSVQSLFVNMPFKIDEANIYEIMSQLTKDNVDFADTDRISIKELGGKNG